LHPVQTDLNLTLLSLSNKLSWTIAVNAQLPLGSTYNYKFNVSSWSSDSRNIVFWDTDDRIFTVTVPSFQVYQVSPPQKGFSSFLAWESSDLLTFNWTTTEDLTRWTSDLYTYTVSTGQLNKPLSKTDRSLNIIPRFFSFSENMQYLAVADGKLYIVDQPTNHITVITAKTDRLNPTNNFIWNNISSFLWHPNGRWLITESSDLPFLLNVVNADGTIQRELTLCSNAPSCFGWLPD
jgi:hypothetical protein